MCWQFCTPPLAGSETEPGQMPKPAESLARRMFGAAPNPREISLICWSLFIILLAWPTCVAVYGAVRRQQSLHRVPDVDFVYFYAMGRVFNKYPASQLYDYELQKQVCSAIRPMYAGGVYGPNPYSPFVGILFRPFALLPFLPAFALWTGLSFSLYLLGLFLFARQFFHDDPHRRSLSFCFALSFSPFFWTIAGGQISTIGFFALALAFREEDRQRPLLSGLALSLCMYKPTLLILLLPMLLITRRYKTLVGFAGGAAAMAAFVTVAQGASIWPGYVTRLVSFGSATTKIHSFVVLWYHVDLNSFSALLPGGRSWLGGSVIFGCAGLAGIALVRAWWVSRRAGPPTGTLIWAVTLTWTLILNLYVPFHDCILIVLSFMATAAVLKHSPNLRFRRQFALLGFAILASSWISLSFARTTGFQILTVLFVVFGMLQLAVFFKTQSPPASCGHDHGHGAPSSVKAPMNCSLTTASRSRIRSHDRRMGEIIARGVNCSAAIASQLRWLERNQI
jgi:hypothetical protein